MGKFLPEIPVVIAILERSYATREMRTGVDNSVPSTMQDHHFEGIDPAASGLLLRNANRLLESQAAASSRRPKIVGGAPADPRDSGSGQQV